MKAESAKIELSKKASWLCVSGESSSPPSVSGDIQLMHPTRRSLGNHPGCAGLLRWGVAVSSYPEATSLSADHPAPRLCRF